jgi:hypothetical protein
LLELAGLVSRGETLEEVGENAPERRVWPPTPDTVVTYLVGSSAAMEVA